MKTEGHRSAQSPGPLRQGRRNLTRLPWVLAAMAFSLSAGCLSSRHQVDVEPALEVSGAWLHESGAAPRIDRWWSSYGSETLNSLVDGALSQNMSLTAALLRVEQSEATVRQQRSGLFPTLDVEAGVNRSRQFVPPPIGSFEQTFFTTSFTAGYELDVWGRVRSGIAAARADQAALRMDAEAVATTLAANVTEAWLDLQFHRARQALVESQIRTVQTYLELIIVRMSSGQATALEALQQQQQMRALESQLPAIQSSQQIAANRLAVLLGVTPSALELPAMESLPSALELPDAGVPADLLQMRPDVRAAQARAEAADWRVVTAICDRLPSFRLAGTLNMQAPNLLDLFDGIFWRLAASAAAPLIDGGRRRAAVERARLVRDEALMNWGQTLLTAVVEVEDALVQQQGQRAYLDRLRLEHENATATLTAARDQYLNGVADYLRVLTAISALQQIELAQLQAQRTLLSQQVTLFRALGGDWVSEIGLSDRGEE